MPTLARVYKGGNDHFQWTSIKDTSPRSPNFRDSSHASSFLTSDRRPRARLSRPPNLTFSISSPTALSVPISPLATDYYTHRSNTYDPALACAVDVARQHSFISLCGGDGEDAGASDSARRDGARTGEVARQPALKNRISTVSQYPVFVSPDSRSQSVDGRSTRLRKRPNSVTSCSSYGLNLAVGALPGSNRFGLDSLSQSPSSRPAAQAQSDMHVPNDITVIATNQPVSISRYTSKINEQHLVSPITLRDHRISAISTDLEIEYSPSTIPQSPLSTRRQSIQRIVKQSANQSDNGYTPQDHGVEWSSTIIDPPTPPPKDEGYMRRPTTRAAKELRECTSAPHLRSIISTPRIKHQPVQKHQSRPAFRSSQSRSSYFCSPSGMRDNRTADVPGSTYDSAAYFANESEELAHNNTQSHSILVAWARLLRKAIAKAQFHRQGS